MLAHSPPLPLVIDYDYDITEEDEKAIILALAQRDRVQRIRFYIPFLKLQRLIMVIDGEYPILEYLILMDISEKRPVPVLTLPETLQIPRLRHLTIDCSIPIRFQLFTTAVGLVTLCLRFHHPSTYFQPTFLLQSLSLIPQLEVLLIYFHFAVPKRDVERQLLRTPITTHVTLPKLRTFGLRAVSAYTEAVLSQITAPRLENILIFYPKQLTFSVPQLLQFIGRTENPKLDRALFHFYGEQVYVKFNPPETRKKCSDMPVAPFSINVDGWHLDWQVSSMAQILNALGQIFSTVEHLILWHKDHCLSSEEHNEVDRAEWLNFLRPFCNVRKLHIDDGLVEELSRCLRLEDGEHSSEVLPELQELTYSGSGDSNDVFTAFIDARQNAGRPVTLIKS